MRRRVIDSKLERILQHEFLPVTWRFTIPLDRCDGGELIVKYKVKLGGYPSGGGGGGQGMWYLAAVVLAEAQKDPLRDRGCHRGSFCPP
jgi:hypothetical protein